MIRAALVALLLAMPGAAPLAAATKLVAVGDSITVGSSWPAVCGVCPVVFDCTTPGCNTSPASARDLCGYVGRLDAWLGPGYTVVNEGVGGEITAEAVTRIDGELDAHCGTPGDCAAVILMHGTNDMDSGIGPEAAKNNLATIVAKAKSRNIDVLLMTIIRRVYAPGNPTWSSYRTKILDLATSESLQSVDPWSALCAGTACFDANYWVDGSECTLPPDFLGDESLGHLDPDGYDELVGLVQAVFPAGVPAAPSLTAPTGDIGDTTPDFVWPEVASARWYELEVDGSSTWWEAAAYCSGGTCTVDPGQVLSEGPHSSRVRGRNLRGVGSWSTAVPFEVWGVPAAPTPLGPTGVLFEVAPLYVWAGVAGATEYDIEVRDSMNNLDASASALAASSVCASGRCAHLEGTVLTVPDDYTLRVRGRNPVFEGPLSSPGLGFSIIDCLDPSQKDLEDLEPSPVTTTEVVQHCGPVTAGAVGPYTIEASGDLTVHTRDGFEAYNGFTVEGALTVKSP